MRSKTQSKPSIPPWEMLLLVGIGAFGLKYGATRVYTERGVALAYVPGWHTIAIATGSVVGALVAWRASHAQSFRKVIVTPAKARARRHLHYQLRWKSTMTNANLLKNDKPARIRRCRTAPHGDRLLIRLAKGQATEDFEKAHARLAHAFGAQTCRVQEHKPGWLWLHFGNGTALRDTIPALPIPDEPDLEQVTIGECEDGTPWRIWLHGAHLLIIGAMGSGKGSVIWSIIRGVAPAIRDGLVDLRMCDPKGGMELRIGEPLCTAYEDDSPEKMVALLTQAADDMDARSATLASRGLRKLEAPTREFPLVLIVVDEFADLTQHEDKKVRDAAANAAGRLLRKGRANGFHLMAVLQDGRIEAIPQRRLFPTTVLLRVKGADEVDRVLGQGARERGALCDRLRFKVDAGKGYIQLEGRRETLLVRAAFPDDADIEAMVAEYAPRPEPSAEEIERLEEAWRGPSAQDPANEE